MAEHDPLIDFVSTVSGDGFLKVEETLGDGYVRLRVPEAERRQAKHDIRGVEDIVVELLRNARDAHAQRIFFATAREGDTRLMTIIDDGVGVPAALHETIFEPRVTSKLETMVMDRWGVHGRGMALFSVRSNASVARVASSAPHKGAAIEIVADTQVLPERADQSTWPVVEADDSGAPRVVRGPHNIVRRVVEFACEHPSLEIYIGTPTEVLATLYSSGRDALDVSDLMFCDDLDRLQVWLRPGACADAEELTETASAIGLGISERTAHGVLGQELAPLEPLMTQLLATEDDTGHEPAPDIYRDRRSLRIHHGDLVAFKRDLTKAFDALADRYYMSLRGEPRINVGRDAISVRFSVEKDD
jgi:hypothetical protein